MLRSSSAFSTTYCMAATHSKSVIDTRRSFDTGRSSRSRRSTSTATRQRLIHRSSQNQLQPTERQPTRQQSHPGLSQTTGHLRRLSAVDYRVRQRGRTPVLPRGRDAHQQRLLCLRQYPKSSRLGFRHQAYRVLPREMGDYRCRVRAPHARLVPYRFQRGQQLPTAEITSFLCARALVNGRVSDRD